MQSGKIFAARFAGTPIHRGFRRVVRKLARYLDRMENWGNIDPATNGEYFLLERGSRHWRVALDIGANVGDWTARLVTLAPACAVYCFEASPRTFASLQRRLGNVPQVRLHALGVGEKTGEFAFFDCGADSGLSSFVSRADTIQLKAEQTVTVALTTVDQFCEQHGLAHLDFVKLDTEGYEAPILRGMGETLRRRAVSAVQFEYGGTWLDAGESLAGVHRWLGRHGYSLFRLLPRAVEPVRYDPQIHEGFKYTNYLAVQDGGTLERWGIPILDRP